MNKDFFKSSNPSRFHSLRDTRPEPTTWQVLFKEITNSAHTAATRHYRAHLATLSDIEATGAYAFDARVRKELAFGESDPPVEYAAELKFDGLAINLRYSPTMK